MNGQATTFDVYHILPQTKKETSQEKKQKIARIDFSANRRDAKATEHIDYTKVEQFRKASRHEQMMEYLLSSLYAIISIVAIISFVVAF